MAMPKARTKPRNVRTTRQSKVSSPQLVRRANAQAVEVAAAKPVWPLAIALMITSIAVYAPVLWHPFVNYDDQAYVVENEHIHSGITPPTLKWALVSMEESNWHPLTWLSHALDWQLFGANASGHHAVNVVLHGLNAGLLFLLLVWATRARWRSLLVATLFAIHPLNVESVAWVAERKNVLSMFCLLLTLVAYGWYARKPGVVRYLSVVVLFAAGLAAKPMIVTLPFALLLLDYWPLTRVGWTFGAHREEGFGRVLWQRALVEKFPLIALSVASSLITLRAQKQSMAAMEVLPISYRIANSAYAYVMYLWKAVWPARLAVFYPYEGDRLKGWVVGLCLLLLCMISALAWRQRRSHPYLIVGWLWFLGNLVPVIGLVQVGDQEMADRYAYLPLIGIFVMAVWGGVRLLRIVELHLSKPRIAARVAASGMAVLLVLLSLRTVGQIAVWRSSHDLWAHALAVTSENYLAEDYMGTDLLVQAYEATGQRYSDEAAVHFRNAERTNPHDAISHLNIGADLHERGQLQAAIVEYTQVLRYTRDEHLLAKAYIGLGAAYGSLHQFDLAKESYRAATRLEPDNRTLFMKIGELAMTERTLELQKETALHPSAQSYLALAELQQSTGKTNEALVSYEQALKLDPYLDDARTGLASIVQKR